MKKITTFFLTGAAGFVGRHVCKLLTQSGYDVRAVIRNEDAELIGIGVKLWIGDLWDKNLLREAIYNVDVVIHCAGDARFGNGSHYYRANVELTEHIVHQAKLHANKARFVYISTIGAVDRAKYDKCFGPLTEESPACPTSDYGRSKLLAEEVVKSSELPFAIMRPAMVVGGDMRFDSHFSIFARHALNRAFIANFAWPGKFSVIHVDDLASAILKIATDMNAEGETYFCAGEPVSIADYFRWCTPSKRLLPLSLISFFLRHFIQWVPFPLKAMLFPALTASDGKLTDVKPPE